MGRADMSPAHSVEAGRVRQAEVEKDNVKLPLLQILLGLRHGLNVGEFSVALALFVDHFAEQTSVSGIVFDEKKHLDRFLVHCICRF